eukprot:6196934-Pleurochrysis_carterae.AAC.8
MQKCRMRLLLVGNEIVCLCLSRLLWENAIDPSQSATRGEAHATPSPPTSTHPRTPAVHLETYLPFARTYQPPAPPPPLSRRPVRDYLQLIRRADFNAIRLPFSAHALTAAQQPPLCAAQWDMEAFNKRYTRRSYLSMLQLFVQDAAEAGLLVMLDLHHLVENAGNLPNDGRLSSHNGHQAMESAWRQIASEMCDHEAYWNFFAADLRNEPHAAYWGPAGPNPDVYKPGERWDEFAATLGNAIHSLCPRLLIVVEGVGHCMSAPQGEQGCHNPSAVNQMFRDNVFTWWGENLQGATQFPVRLQRPNKVWRKHARG